MNIRRAGLDKTVRQPLQVPNLVPFSIPVFLVVVSEHRGPGDLSLGHDLREFGQDGFRIPRRALAIQLVASEDNKIRLLSIKNFRKEGRSEVVRALAWGEDCVQASALGDGEV